MAGRNTESLPYKSNKKALETFASRALSVCFDLRQAVRTRLELATSCVTGRHSNQLNYRTRYNRSPSEAVAKLSHFLNSAKLLIKISFSLKVS